MKDSKHHDMNTAAIVPDPPAMSTSFIQGIDNTTVIIGAFGFSR